jgi:serine/threonine-protein kinase
MEERTRTDNLTLDAEFAGQLAQVCADFEAACQAAVRTAKLPNVDTYIMRVPPADRVRVRQELDSIRVRYQQPSRPRAAQIGLLQASGVDVGEDAAPGEDSVTALELPQAEPLAGSPNAVGSDFTVDHAPSVSGDELNLSVSPAKGDSLTSPSGLVSTDFSLGDGAGAPTRWPEVLGYEILGELGRGGMGVVYKARQRGLNRLVALKMIVAGASASPHQLARFHTEAQAVARLLHPNIVQIYDVGEQDGLPFFSLEFVGGGSLDKEIAGKPQPPRSAARLVETLARAMHHAHTHGIVHRDLKPANILLTPDGVPKIADFGLAKRLEEGESSQTKTGVIMGTPSYMAPEQARGDAHEVGPAADLYTLGAILYELLTGRVPFLGSKPVHTVMQVISDEPLPPRRLQPDVPPDIETICLKCLQKEPSKRYADCFQLAEDLHRFQADIPILARPIGSLERFRRWCKRNPRVAGLTAAVFMLLMTGLVGSLLAAYTIAQERNQKEAERQAAVEARQIADEQVALALETTKDLIHEVQNRLEGVPRSHELKKKLLEIAARDLKKVEQRAQGVSSREVAFAAAAVHMRLGLVFRDVGDTEDGFQQVMLSHEINQKLWQEEPDSGRTRRNLAASFTVLGDMSQGIRRDIPAALEYYQQALRLRQELHDSPTGREPVEAAEITSDLAETHMRVGSIYYARLGDPAAALAHFRKALTVREELARQQPRNVNVRADLARSYFAVGELSFHFNDAAMGWQCYEKCFELREAMTRENPGDYRLKQELAGGYASRGDLHLRVGDCRRALADYQRCFALCLDLVQVDRQNVFYQSDLARAYYQLGTVKSQLREPAASRDDFGQSLKIREELAKKDPKNAVRQIDLMITLPHCGHDARAAQLAESLRSGPATDPELFIAIGCCYAQCAAVAGDPKLKRQYTDKALGALSEAVNRGFRDALFFETDPDVELLRHDAAFMKLLERVKKEPAADSR